MAAGRKSLEVQMVASISYVMTLLGVSGGVGRPLLGAW